MWIEGEEETKYKGEQKRRKENFYMTKDRENG